MTGAIEREEFEQWSVRPPGGGESWSQDASADEGGQEG